ncbi:MAG: hypothetical protein EOP83_31560 [Verrucomicrobiaceae bacterium]|nr:MAG: hypothetical protein EOP83_31560 [Verrucomicrobiaceae bacterium]
MILSIKPNRCLTEEDFKAVAQLPIYLEMLQNRVCIRIPHSTNTAVTASMTHYVVEQWLIENAMGLFHVKTQHDTGGGRRIDIYLAIAEDGVNIKIRMDGTDLRQWSR